MNDSAYFYLAIVGTLLVVFVALGVHQAINKLLGILDGHLERFQGKLDVMLAAQIEHNDKIDAILHKLF